MNDLRTLKFPPHLSGHIGLDFINTAEYRGTNETIEFFKSYTDILGWCWQNKFLSRGHALLLQKVAEESPEKAQAAYERGITLREALLRIGSAIVKQEELDLDDSANGFVIDELRRLIPNRVLIYYPNEARCRWEWHFDGLDTIWGPVLLETAELFASDRIQQLGQCPGCGWLFLDTSRNHQRRWCSMEICGSRAKSRRQYQRRKAGG